MNELTNVVVTYTLPKIAYDLKEVKEQVNVVVSKYKGLVISEDDIPEMKKDIAMLNKLSKSIDAKRKGVVKEIKEPLKSFEDELKLIVSDLNTTYRDIKDQIDSFTEEQKKVRKTEILAFEEWKDYYEFDERWLGKSKTDKSIKEDITHFKQIYDNGVTLIETTCKMVGLDTTKYIELLQAKKAINEIVIIIQNDKEIKEQYSAPETKVEAEPVSVVEEPKYYETYQVVASKSQHELLEKFMLENGIEYQIQEGGLF